MTARAATQDALVAALEKWPLTGVPDNPGAWLMATAKHRAIDLMRRRRRLETKQEELAWELGVQLAMSAAERPGAEVGDDVLALMFTCCHPVLSVDARVALTLKLLGGLSTPAIARAFLVPETTVAQRIVRAKQALADDKVPFGVPSGDALAPRLASVPRSST